MEWDDDLAIIQLFEGLFPLMVLLDTVGSLHMKQMRWFHMPDDLFHLQDGKTQTKSIEKW